MFDSVALIPNQSSEIPADTSQQTYTGKVHALGDDFPSAQIHSAEQREVDNRSRRRQDLIGVPARTPHIKLELAR
jgi:hypothetical protein